MAVYVSTNTPKKLLSTYKKAIDQGHVTTWSYDKDGDFTHTAEQWNRKAWLRPRVEEGKALVLYILKQKDVNLSKTVYAVYHGRFVESLLRHCDELFEEIRTTASPEGDDRV